MNMGPTGEARESAETRIFMNACMCYERLLDATFGLPNGKAPDLLEACMLVAQWIARVRELHAYSDTSFEAHQRLLESEEMRKALIASICEEIGEGWGFIDAAIPNEAGFLKAEVPFTNADRLRVGRLRLMLRLSRPFLDESLQRHLVRRALTTE
jgi:hypothetical protein